MMRFLRWLSLKFFLWAWGSRIQYVKDLAIAHAVDNADIHYDNKSADYWVGSGDGIMNTLKLLEMEPLQGRSP